MADPGLHSDLLDYNSTHRVLVCRQCRYAVQRNALPGHLSRHKVNRAERQRLLKSAAKLDIPEPENVVLPTVGSPPVELLPVLAGFRCTAAEDCQYLCASEKRARSHLSQAHGLVPKDDRESLRLRRAAKLQTFFRGSKIRYFEVDFRARVSPDQDGNESQEKIPGVADAPRSSAREGDLAITSGSALPRTSLFIDLEAMAYFHHFTTYTSLTLPAGRLVPSAIHYWQTDVVLQALQHRWLMCGILAISARHLATSADDISQSEIHDQRAHEFFTEYSNDWKQSLSSVEDFGNTALPTEETSVAGIGRKVVSILTLAAYSPHLLGMDSRGVRKTVGSEVVHDDLASIIAHIRGLYFSFTGLEGSRDKESRNTETMTRAKSILESKPPLSSSSIANARTMSRNEIPRYNTSQSPGLVFDRFRDLPHLMALALGKPDNIKDVLGAVLAIGSLVICFDASLGYTGHIGAGTGTEEAQGWHEMARWTVETTEHFNDMITRQAPGALVVVAHWAAFLVTKAEVSGSWFLLGLGKAICELIMQRLSTESSAVQRLVSDLI
jgi:hypothetical protein